MASDPISLALADELRKRREAKKLTQAAIAAAVNMRRNVYQRLEYCERACTTAQLEAIAAVLGVAGSDILKAAEQRVAQGDVPQLSQGESRLRGAFGIDP